jgi:hypothetical protein
VICALILALTATEGRGQKTQSADLSRIVALLQKHDNALNQHDIDGIMSVFAPTSNIVVLGGGWINSGTVADGSTAAVVAVVG